MSLNLPTSGNWFIGTSNTPYGTPKQVAVDNPYLTKDEFITNEAAIGLGITSSSPIYTSGRLDRLLVQVAGEVNRICRRWFDTQTIDETKMGLIVRPWNPQLVTVPLQNAPYSQIISIYFQVLKWFIQIDTSSGGYLQDFPDLGFYKIVPLLSNSGTGAGSPMPAEIVDKVPLGVLWTQYTFGFGSQQLAQPLTYISTSSDKQYQLPLYARLIAPSQPIVVYSNGTVVNPVSNPYSFDYPNGIITFTNTIDHTTHTITMDYISNESIPFDIKEAVALLVCESIGQGSANPTGAKSLGMQTFSVSYGDKTYLRERAMEILQKYAFNTPIMF
jgi:hypothetical protein